MPKKVLKMHIIANLILKTTHVSHICATSAFIIPWFIKQKFVITTFSYNQHRSVHEKSNGYTVFKEIKLEPLSKIFQNETTLTEKEWTQLFCDMTNEYKNMEPYFPTVLMKMCLQYNNYSLGHSLFEYSKNSNLEINSALIALFMILCKNNVAKCKEGKILDTYSLLIKNTPVLDINLSEKCIMALCVTSEWKKSFEHLSLIKQMDTVSHKIYSAIICAAFRNSEVDLGWNYLKLMCSEGRVPDDDVFLEWLGKCSLLEPSSCHSAIFRMFDFLKDFSICPSEIVMKKVSYFLKDYKILQSSVINLYNRWCCSSCSEEMLPLKVEKEKFNYLKETFISKVMIGSDIFQSTSPEEWNNFKRFVRTQGPFTTIVDGLNIVYLRGKQSKRARMDTIYEVVEQLSADPNSSVLVICRQHMQNWSIALYKKLLKISQIYLVNNMSVDDCFFIYAAFHSGLGCRVVTRDFLRDHVFKLLEGEAKKTFLDWQQTHQIFPQISKAKIILEKPLTYACTAQQSKRDSWHIPYTDGSSRIKPFSLVNNWYCIRKL